MLKRILFALCFVAGLASADTSVGSLEPTSGTWRVDDGARRVCAAKSEDGAKVCAAADAETRRTTTRYRISYPNRYLTVTYAVTPPPPTPSPDVIWRSDLKTTDGFGEVWGSPAPSVANDSLAADGKALRYQWRSGPENYNGAYVDLQRLTGKLQPKVCMRLRLRQDATARNGGIQKIIRFRGANDRPIGTVNIQWGQWLFYGDSLGDGENHTQTSATLAALGPDTLRGRYRYVEACVDHTGPHHVWVYVDGQLVIDYAGGYSAPPVHGMHVLGTYNEPADTRSDWVDEIVVSRSRIGI